jgi:hypothetical protein
MFLIVFRHGKLLFKIYVSLLLHALQGGGGGDEIKRLLETKSDKITFLVETPKHLKRGKISKTIITMAIIFPHGRLIEVKKRDIFRTLEKLGGMKK